MKLKRKMQLYESEIAYVRDRLLKLEHDKQMFPSDEYYALHKRLENRINNLISEMENEYYANRFA